MKRKKMTKSLAVVIVFTMLMTLAAVPAVAETFSDLPQDWSKDAVSYAIDNGLLVGYEGKVFPTNNLSRAELASIVNRILGTSEKADISAFTDVPAGKWYVADLAKAVNAELLFGAGTKLSPEAAVSREAAFAILARAFKLSTTSTTALDKFIDKGDIAEYFKSDIAALVEAGYVKGSNNKLFPKQNITRAEFAQVLYSFIGTYVKAAGTVTEVADGSVVVSAADVTLKGVTVTGDLVLGDGVGTGDGVIDGSKVLGRTVVRGGGVNSIKVINGSTLTGKVIVDNVNGAVRIVTDAGTTIETLEAGSEIVLAGTFGEIVVVGSGTSVTVATGSKINKITTSATATAPVITVNAGALVTTVVANAAGTKIAGSGIVSTVEANANNVAVTTPGTTVKAAAGVTGVTANGVAVAPGGSSTTPSGSTGGGSGTVTNKVTSVGFIKSDNTTINSTVSGTTYTINLGAVPEETVIKGFKVNSSSGISYLKVAGVDNQVTAVTSDGTFTLSGNNSLVAALLDGITFDGDVSVSTIKSILGSSFSRDISIYNASGLVQTLTLKIVFSDDTYSGSLDLLDSYTVSLIDNYVVATLKAGEESKPVFASAGFYTLVKSMVTVPAGYEYNGIYISNGDGEDWGTTKDDLQIATNLKEAVGKESVAEITLGDLKDSEILVLVVASKGDDLITTAVFFE